MSFHLLVDAFAQLEVIQIDDFLNNKVSKLVLNILERVDNNVVDNLLLHMYVFPGIFDDFFHNTETILVLRKLLKIVTYVVE